VTFFFEASAAAAAPVEIVSPSTATEAKRAASSSLSDDEDDEEASMRSMRLKRPLVEGVRPACAALWARFRQFEFECENTFANCERKKIQKSSQTLFSLFSRQAMATAEAELELASQKRPRDDEADASAPVGAAPAAKAAR